MLAAALDGFDEPRAQSTLDQLFSEATVESVLTEVILPYLEELGERWEGGEATVAQEHFSTQRPAWTTARPGAGLGSRPWPGGTLGLSSR